MGKVRKVIVAGVIFSLVTLSLTGCVTYNNFKDAFIDKKESGDTIRIGVYEPMTGADSKAAAKEIEGIKLANKLYPQVSGKKIELIYADNNSEIDVAETAIADLVKKKPLAVLGSYGSIYSLMAGKYLQAAEIPGVSITNTNPLVTSNNPYYFRVCVVESYEGEALARYAFKKLKQTQTAIMIPEDSDQATAIASAYRAKFEAVTKNVDALVSYEEYKPGDKDFLKQLTAIKKSGSKTVFLTGQVDDVALILKQADRMNLKVTFLGDSQWSTEEFINSTSGYIKNNIAFPTLFSDNQEGSPIAEQFLNAYGRTRDAEDTEAAALGFDAYLLVRNAIEKSGDKPDGKQVRDQLAQTKNFSSASGQITFTPTGDPEKTVIINTIVNNEVKPIYTIDPVNKIPTDQKTKEDKNGAED